MATIQSKVTKLLGFTIIITHHLYMYWIIITVINTYTYTHMHTHRERKKHVMIDGTVAFFESDWSSSVKW